jgi:hypothetical protein
MRLTVGVALLGRCEKFPFQRPRDLAKRPPEYRKIIIAISDGQDARGVFHAQDILPRLVRDQIQFYAVTTSVPVMDRVTSTLASYANATGRDVYSGRTEKAMQNAFAWITEQARQYVLSYVSNNEVTGSSPAQRKCGGRLPARTNRRIT